VDKRESHKIKEAHMTDQQITFANAIKTRLDAIAETGTIKEFDALMKTGVDIAIAIERIDPEFVATEFIKIFDTH
tara:strand:+ start:886 stop:1110 length:225 start_codon:yes stop_codon:yes gene_type:complete